MITINTKIGDIHAKPIEFSITTHTMVGGEPIMRTVEGPVSDDNLNGLLILLDGRRGYISNLSIRTNEHEKNILLLEFGLKHVRCEFEDEFKDLVLDVCIEGLSCVVKNECTDI